MKYLQKATLKIVIAKIITMKIKMIIVIVKKKKKTK